MGNKTVRAGWYLDRDDPDLERYWDGKMWTGETRRSPSLNDFLGPIEPLLMEMIGLPKENGELDLDEEAHSSGDKAHSFEDKISRVNRTTATN